MGFEPTCVGFANRCLTTWLPHQTLAFSMLAGPLSEGGSLHSRRPRVKPDQKKRRSGNNFDVRNEERVSRRPEMGG